MTNDAEPTVIECTLSLSGRDFDPDAVTHALGQEPTKIWRQKRPALAARTDLPNIEWQFTVGPEAWTSTDEAVIALMNPLLPKCGLIRRCATDLHLKTSVVCTVFIYDQKPGLFISSESLRALSEMGAEFSFDIYDRRELD